MSSRREFLGTLSLLASSFKAGLGIGWLIRSRKPETYASEKYLPTRWKVGCCVRDVEKFRIGEIDGVDAFFVTFRGVERQVTSVTPNEDDPNRTVLLMGFRTEEISDHLAEAKYYAEELNRQTIEYGRRRQAEFIGPTTMKSRPYRTTKPRFTA